ncbi:T9SS type A sorting domain-containing protein [Porphyromonas gulae]|uniref:T9SS type A sorting domain-containing protein n=1 Tax=Porphyromonas gulae TaxID=111105 RepID=UPI0009B7F540|nr:T9SS type A sorting domain-containing protein [Porphyromonas gulae]
MRRVFLWLLILIATGHLRSQVLPVTEITQLQSEWCWAGVSACILDYYSISVSQCEIAEYTRTVETFPDVDLGNIDCCMSAPSCNHWNYNWGGKGSVQDILVHFGSILNFGVSAPLTQEQVASDIQKNRLFVIRWGWSTGGGHFVVGHGLVGDKMYYMDPWYGEGLKIADYSWVVSGGKHKWTHTNRLSVTPSDLLPVNTGDVSDNIKVYPNPVLNNLVIEVEGNDSEIDFYILDTKGRIVFKGSLIEKQVVRTGDFAPGVYVVKFRNGKTFEFRKIIKE